jgi:hypothetical protein
MGWLGVNWSASVVSPTLSTRAGEGGADDDRRDLGVDRRKEKMMPKLKGPIDQAKVVQIADTLKQGFRGDEVLDSYDEDRSSQLYRISRGTALVHRVYVSKGFLDDNTAVQIDQLLQAWGVVEKIRAAGARLVTINSHGIQIVGE